MATTSNIQRSVMWRTRWAILAGWVLVNGAAHAQEDAALQPLPLSPVVEAFENAVVTVIERSKEAVVAITARDVLAPSRFRRLTEEERIPFTTGSGFFVRTDGHLLTNAHVVRDARTIEVRLVDGTRLEGTLAGIDLNTDIAAIKVSSEKPTPALPLADESGSRIGQFVLSIGSPFSLDFTANVGIISAKGRTDMLPRDPDSDLILYQDFIQTDAYLNRGNSGGPLLNLRGEVVGMNSMIRTSGTSNDFSGIGFAIPSAILRTVGDQLIERGKVARGWLGIGFRSEEQGIRINRVIGDSPADQGGLRRSDLITAVNDQPVSDIRDFRWMIANLTAGSVVRFVVLRENGPVEVRITLGEMPPQFTGQEEKPKESDTPFLSHLGLTGIPLQPELAEIHGFRSEARGVFVIRVEPGSPMREAGLSPGDLLVTLNGQEVASPRDCEMLLSEALQRGDREATLAVQTGDIRHDATVSLSSLSPPPNE